MCSQPACMGSGGQPTGHSLGCLRGAAADSGVFFPVSAGHFKGHLRQREGGVRSTGLNCTWAGCPLGTGSHDTYENLYLSPLSSFLEKTFCKLE